MPERNSFHCRWVSALVWGLLAALPLQAVVPVADAVLTSQVFPAGESTIAGLKTLTTNGAITIPASAQVVFKAGTSISLGAGFSVQPGGTFAAAISAIDTDLDGISDLDELALGRNPELYNSLPVTPEPDLAPIPYQKPSNYPAWWFQRKVIAVNANATNPTSPSWPGDYPPANDYSVVNQGQVKYLAHQAYKEMKKSLAGGTGATLDGLWARPVASTDDFAVINLGQLKYLAKPFYDRLALYDPYITYPWAKSPTPADDYALANIGQVKQLFAFELADVLVDSNQNQVSDYLEKKYIGHLISDLSNQTDTDGIPDVAEFLLKTDPTRPAQIVPIDVADGSTVNGVLNFQVFTP